MRSGIHAPPGDVILPGSKLKADTQGAAPPRSLFGWLRLYLELGKYRLSLLVVMTTGVGYLLSPRESPDPWRLVATLCGTYLAALGANALNMWIERERDRLMVRTMRRPLPSGRITPRHALAAGLCMALAGDLLLFLLANPLTAGLALLTQVVYAGIYTPLKVVTPYCTLAGALTGAIPPLMGFAAATGRLEPPAFVLAALLFTWQMPHFLALAWMFSDDYARGGYRMLPLVDAGGSATCRMLVLYSLALMPMGLAAAIAGLTGLVFGIAALVLGAALLALALRLCVERSAGEARRVFLGSVIYLPLLLLLMLLDPGPYARGLPGGLARGLGRAIPAAVMPTVGMDAAGRPEAAARTQPGTVALLEDGDVRSGK